MVEFKRKDRQYIEVEFSSNLTALVTIEFSSLYNSFVAFFGCHPPIEGMGETPEAAIESLKKHPYLVNTYCS